jgi:hypothetical protein
MNRFACLVTAALFVSITGAQATQQGTAALRNWKLMDLCAKQAQAAYPDYNAVSNTKRDAMLKACLNANVLPPRQPTSTPESR